MPRKKAHCARRRDHKGDCRTAEALADSSRKRKTERRRGIRRKDDPVVRARWNRTHTLSLLGMTEEKFSRMLEAQGGACGMCRRPFEEGERVHVDHDHACCPDLRKDKRARSCGKCIRGLLCFRCNTALGYIEKYGPLAEAYLAQAATKLAA